jgi:16S rRNA (guanine966-N2)-methyltransferase
MWSGGEMSYGGDGRNNPMRVVAGTARGRALTAPSGKLTRPTSDRVREAVFSMLISMQQLEDAAVVDLFAGSGALGIEAVSRGAARAVLVDSDAAAVRAIRRNVEVLGPLAARATVLRADALKYALDAPFADVVLADPPYAFSGWPVLLDRLSSRVGTLVAETGSRWDPGPAWETVRVKTYGATVVTVARPLAPPGAIVPAEAFS